MQRDRGRRAPDGQRRRGPVAVRRCGPSAWGRPSARQGSWAGPARSRSRACCGASARQGLRVCNGPWRRVRVGRRRARAAWSMPLIRAMPSMWLMSLMSMSPIPMSVMVARRARTERGHRRDHADLRGKRGTRHAGTVPGFGDERIGLRLRLHDHVIGFGDGDLEFVDRHWPDVEAVGLDDRQFQAWNPHVEVRHRRGVDDAQPHPLAGREQRGPIVGGAMAVDQIGVGAARHVGHVGRVHPHRAPARRSLSGWSLPASRPAKVCFW